jgi:MFS family permease
LIESAHHRTAAFAGSASPWAPLGIRVFRMLWLASLVSNIGSWMHLVASAWLMTSLTASAALVALLQTANAGPSFLFALPAGALADVLDRRRLVVVTQAWQLVVAGALGVITLAHLTTPAVLLAMTFALAVGAALGSPAFSALTPELVPHDQLPSAVSLNSSSFTASQAVGPALGGLLVAAFGSGAVFLVNAGSFLAVVLVAAGWRRSRPPRDLPAEHLAAAIRTGVRYVVNAPEFRSVLVRAAGYVVCFSALPALLAVIARVRLHGTASAYGVLLGCIGIGGVAGTFVVPLLRARWSIDRLVTAGTLGYAVVLAGLSATVSFPAAGAILIAGGLVGMANLSSFNIAAQSALPDWVRGRGLAVFQLVFMLSFAGGAAVWGEVASLFGIATTLVAAGAALAASTLLGLRFQLRGAQAIDVALTDRPEPYVPVTLRPEDGPVQLTVEYRVASEDEEAFLEAVAELGRMRRRDGVLLWGLYSDPLVPDRHVESFISPSWTEHYRTSQRLTRDDRAILDRVRGFHRGEEPRLTALVGHDFSRHSSHRHVRAPMLARLWHEQAPS